MARSFVVGLDCRLYVYTADRSITPPTAWNPANIANYTEVPTTRDVTLNLTTATADATNRGSVGWRQNVVVLHEGSVDTNILWLPDPPATGADYFAAMINAYLDGCPMAALILDGPIAGLATGGRCNETGLVTGLHADFNVTDFTRNEGMEDVLTADVSLEIGLGAIVPEWISDITAIPPP